MSFPRKAIRFAMPGLFTEEDEERERQAMALEEISGGNADLYGTAHIPSKSEQSLGEALSELDAELEQIPCERKRIFLEALEKCPDQVDDEHRIAFLWREEFHAKLAAERLVAYWEHKHEIFGEDKCYLPLTLEGALKDDIPALSSGVFQLLPVKDMSGRTMVIFDPSRRDTLNHSHDSVLRAFWYTYHAALEDPETQKRGIVYLAFVKHARPHQFDTRLYPMIMELETIYLPVRCCSLHICHPDPFFRAISPIAKFILGKRIRARLCVHFGTEQAVLEKLMNFGIPPERVPTNLGGQLVLDLTKWLFDRLGLEKTRGLSAPNQALVDTKIAAGMQLCEQALEGADRSIKRRRDCSSHTATGDGNAALRSRPYCQPLSQGLNLLQSPSEAGVPGIAPTNINWLLSGGASNAVTGSNTIYHSLLDGVLRSLPSQTNGIGHNPTNVGTATGTLLPLFLGNTGSAMGASANSFALSQLLLAQAGMTGGANIPASTLQLLQFLNNGNVVSGTGTAHSYLAAHSTDAVALQQVQRALHDLSLQAERAHLIKQLLFTRSSGSATNIPPCMPGPALLVIAPPQQQPATAAGLLGNFHGVQLRHSSHSSSRTTSAAVAHTLYLPHILSLPLDEKKISAHQCLIRKQIEAFAATEEHVRNHARGRNKSIFMGQVGIRCRHCKGLPLTSFQRGSLYFPTTLIGMYQTAQNMAGFHINNPSTCCKNMPQEVKDEFKQVLMAKSTDGGGKKKSKVGGGKDYWAEAGKMIGLVDTPYGIRFVG